MFYRRSALELVRGALSAITDLILCVDEALADLGGDDD